MQALGESGPRDRDTTRHPQARLAGRKCSIRLHQGDRPPCAHWRGSVAPSLLQEQARYSRNGRAIPIHMNSPPPFTIGIGIGIGIGDKKKGQCITLLREPPPQASLISCTRIGADMQCPKEGLEQTVSRQNRVGFAAMRIPLQIPSIESSTYNPLQCTIQPPRCGQVS